jgi:molecular chaperone DnaK
MEIPTSVARTVLVEHIINSFKETGIDLAKDQIAIQRIREAAEKTKIELSSTSQTETNLPFISSGPSGPQHINQKLLCSQFESLTAPLVQRAVGLCKKALTDACVKPSDINTSSLWVVLRVCRVWSRRSRASLVSPQRA